jgi:dTMP kinase
LEVIAIDLQGKLIAFEGIDASGKSTQARLLVKRLSGSGLDVVSTVEPGGTAIGEAARAIVLSRPGVHSAMLPFSELLLFMISRAQNTHEVILPALQAGKTVVVSRYRMSSEAYQGYGRGIDLDLVRDLNHHATQGLRPHVTFLIDISAETAVNRKTTEHDRIEIETLEFHRRVRQGFLELSALDPNAVVIDGDRDLGEIAEDVARYLQV